MKARLIFAGSIAKYEGLNEDFWHIPAGFTSGAPVLLCDGASESYDSRSWARLLAENFDGSQELGPPWLEERIRDYERLTDRENLGWARQLSYERGSFSTFLACRLFPDRCIVDCVGDSVLFLLDSCSIYAAYAYDDEACFNEKPCLISTRRELNADLASWCAAGAFQGELPLDQGGKSRLLMATDALALWILKFREDMGAISRLLAARDQDSFAAFVKNERAAGALKLDDTTLIHIEVEPHGLSEP